MQREQRIGGCRERALICGTGPLCCVKLELRKNDRTSNDQEHIDRFAESITKMQLATGKDGKYGTYGE